MANFDETAYAGERLRNLNESALVAFRILEANGIAALVCDA